MGGLFHRTLTFLRFLAVLTLITISLVVAATTESGAGAQGLISIGEPGAQAVKFKVWTNKEEGEPFRPGDRAIIFLSAEKQAYLTILSISPEGGVTVVLPNKLMKDNMIQPHKLYALFGDDCPVRLTTGEKPGKGKLVLYLSAAPLALEPLKAPEGAGWVTIPADAGKEMQVLREKIRAISQEEDFNRAFLSLPCDTGDNLEIKLTEVSQQAKKKALPGGVESSVPETLTGSAGLKPLRKGNLKQ